MPDRGPWGGVYPAPVCPMRPDQSIDFESLARLYGWLGRRPGIAGLVVNANAGEGTFLSQDERNAVVAAARKVVPPGVRIVAGLVASSTAEGIAQLREVQASGADAALVFPVRDWLISRQAGAAERYFERLSAAADLPIFAFQSPHTRGAAAYELATLTRIAALPTVVGIKNAVWEVRRYQEEYRHLKQVHPALAVLSANDSHVLATLAIGADGVLLGLAGLVPDLIVRLVESLARADLADAREADLQLWPISQAIYHTPPYALRHTRTKAALKILGLIDHDTVREPLLGLDADGTTAVRAALEASGLFRLPSG